MKKLVYFFYCLIAIGCSKSSGGFEMQKDIQVKNENSDIIDLNSGIKPENFSEKNKYKKSLSENLSAPKNLMKEREYEKFMSENFSNLEDLSKNSEREISPRYNWSPENVVYCLFCDQCTSVRNCKIGAKWVLVSVFVIIIFFVIYDSIYTITIKDEMRELKLNAINLNSEISSDCRNINPTSSLNQMKERKLLEAWLLQNECRKVTPYCRMCKFRSLEYKIGTNSLLEEIVKKYELELLCTECKDGYRINMDNNLNFCEKCKVANCVNCTSTAGECEKCTDLYKLENNVCKII